MNFSALYYTQPSPAFVMIYVFPLATLSSSIFLADFSKTFMWSMTAGRIFYFGLNVPVGLIKLVHNIVSSQSKIMTVSYNFGLSCGINQTFCWVRFAMNLLLIWSAPLLFCIKSRFPLWFSNNDDLFSSLLVDASVLLSYYGMLYGYINDAWMSAALLSLCSLSSKFN